MSKKPSRSKTLPAPADLRSSRVVHEGVEYLVLSYPASASQALSCLTPGERAVATLAARGASNTEIARARGVSLRTVCNQLSTAYQKLGVSSRLELARVLAGHAAADP